MSPSTLPTRIRRFYEQLNDLMAYLPREGEPGAEATAHVTEAMLQLDFAALALEYDEHGDPR